MILSKTEEVNKFLDVVKMTKGDVWIESTEGDRISLKSKLSQYIAISALIHNEGNDLMLYCADKADEALFIQFFNDNPGTL